MFAYLFKRAFTLLFVLLGLAVLIFVIARIVPGDPARIALGPLATAEQVTKLQNEMGLNDPYPVQLWTYLSGLAQGDLGKSLLTSRPVMDDIMGALPATFELVLFTVVLQIVISIPLGVIAAIYRNTWVDSVLRVVSLLGVVTPGFVLAIILQLIAAHYLGFFPVTGRIDPGIGFSADVTGLLTIDGLLAGRFDVVVDALRHLFLPAIALAAAGVGQVMRITRTAMIEVSSRDFVEASRAYGIPERVVTFRYMLRVASVAPLTILGLEFASLIGNAFIVEFVFSWPGIASYGVRTILQKDLNAVIGVVLVSGVFFVVANLTIDLLLGILDPPAPYSRGARVVSVMNDPAAPAHGLTARQMALYRFRRNPLAVIGALIVLSVILAAVFAPWIAPSPESAGSFVDFRNRHSPPNWQNLMGTDNVGRDVFSRVVFGYRVSLGLVVGVLGVAVPFGIVLGLCAGYFGGWTETIIMRFTDIMLALPPLAMALAITAVLSPNLINAMIAITLLWWTWHTRLIYRIVKGQMNEDYVEAARVAGASHMHILFRELLPNCFSAVAVKISLDAGFVILFGAALSFLGLGVQPPTPDLGTMVATGSEYLPEMWWQAVMPGLAILYAILGFNLLGDGLRDMLDVEL